jgi:hypothetical protein
MRLSLKGWIGLLAYVVVWDAFTYRRGETLSHGSARAMARNPWLTGAAIVYTALHLMDKLARPFDLFSQTGKIAGWLFHR